MSWWVPGQLFPFEGAKLESAADNDPDQTYRKLLKGIREALRKNGYRQKPQLSSSYKLVRRSIYYPCTGYLRGLPCTGY